MLTFKHILLILQSISPYYEDKETAQERTDRMTILANSIDYAAHASVCQKLSAEGTKKCKKLFDGDPIYMAAMLLTIGRFESAFAKHVHENKCRTKQGECDGGRARSPWQFQNTPLTSKWWVKYKGADLKSTKIGAWAATNVIANAFKGCGSWQGSIAMYATGSTCKWSRAKERYDWFVKTNIQLRKLIKQDEEEQEKQKEKSEDSDKIAQR